MIETRATWTDLIAGVGLEIADVFDQGQEEYLPGIGNVLNTTSGDGAQRNFTGKTGVGRLSKFEDGDDMAGGRRYKTYTTSAIYNNYGKFIEVTANDIEDRNYDAELNEMKDLGVAANFSQDEAGMQMFNGGFATTTTVRGYEINWYGDGVPQFSTIHPSVVPGASTQSNASSTGIKFGHDSLEIAKIALMEQKTDDGIPMSLLGKPMLTLPLALEREGQEETRSELNPENANNAINVYKGTVDMSSSLFLSATNGGSDTAWFLTVPGKAQMYHEMRKAPGMDQAVNIKNGIVTYTVKARWANYSKEWKRTWGSKGDLAAYSA
jgi:hypothetical protein